MKLEDEIKQKKFKTPYQKAAVNLIYTTNWLQSLYSKVLKPYQITVQQYNILRILRGQFPQPCSIKLLKERMLDKMSDASRLVEKLRQKDLLERRICISDRRNVDVLITPKGLEILQALDQLDAVFQENLKTLSEKEINKLNNLLDKIRG